MAGITDHIPHVYEMTDPRWEPGVRGASPRDHSPFSVSTFSAIVTTSGSQISSSMALYFSYENSGGPTLDRHCQNPLKSYKYRSHHERGLSIKHTGKAWTLPLLRWGQLTALGEGRADSLLPSQPPAFISLGSTCVRVPRLTNPSTFDVHCFPFCLCY